MTSSTNMRSLGDMPLELFQEILSYISRGDRKNLASTCKAYKEVLLEAIWAEDVAGPNDALFWGCKNGRLEIVEHAIARGAQVAGVRQPIKQVLHKYDHVSATFINRHVRVLYNASPISLAITGTASLPVIEKLLQNGAASDFDGYVFDRYPLPHDDLIHLALDQARKRKDWCPIDAILLLFSYGAPVPQRSLNPVGSCIYLAKAHQPHCQSDCVYRLTEEFIRRGAAIDYRADEHLEHPIFIAVAQFPPSNWLIKLLIKMGVSLDARGQERILWDLWVLSSHKYTDAESTAPYLEVFETLLQNGASPDGPIWSCLITEVIHDMTEHGMPFLKMLLKYGADVNNHKHDELTPLTAAARKVDLNIMELLLEAGADPNKPDAKEDTPYREATYHRDPQAAIDLLVKYGAVPDQASVDSSLNR